MSDTTTGTRLDRIRAIYREEIPAKRVELDALHREGEELIRDERADGSTAGPIAEASGLSPQRVYQVTAETVEDGHGSRGTDDTDE